MGIYRDTVVADNPFVYWGMGNPPIGDLGAHAGNSAYSLQSGGAGAPLPVAGIFADTAGARHYDGTGLLSYASGIDFSDVSGHPLTVELFVKIDSYGSGDEEVFEIYGSGPWWGSDGGIVMSPGNSTEVNTISFGMHVVAWTIRGTIPRSAIPVDEWHHVVVSFIPDSTVSEFIKVYVDGVKQVVTPHTDTGAPSSGTFPASGTLSIGARSNAAGSSHALDQPCSVDEFAIYKAELSQAQITEHYDAYQTELTGGGSVAPTNSVAPHITPTSAQTGGLLTCSTGTWSGTPTPSLVYQWTRDGANISGATSSTYACVTADEAHVVGCKVTATNTAGSLTVTADNTVTPTAPPAGTPVNTVLPVISTDGTPQIGESISCSQGSWTGDTPLTATYQWTRDSTNISGATVAAYTLAAGDETYAIRCVVTMTNTAGSASATANSVTPVSSPGAPSTPGKKLELAFADNGAWIGLKLAANVDNNEFALDDYDDNVDTAGAARLMMSDAVANATNRETFHSKLLLSARKYQFNGEAVKDGPCYAQLPILPASEAEMKYVLDFVGGSEDSGDWNHWNQGVAQSAACVIESTLDAGNVPDVDYGPPSIVGGPMRQSMFAGAGMASGYSNMLVTWKGIKITSPFDSGTIGLNLLRLAQASIENFGYHAQATREYLAAHQPQNDQTVALLLPIINNNAYVRVGSVGVQGAYMGMNLTDHLAMLRAGFIFCRTALYVPGIGGGHYHGASIVNLNVEAGGTILDSSMASGTAPDGDGRFNVMIVTCNSELQYDTDFIDPKNVLRGSVLGWTEITPRGPTKDGATGLVIQDLYAS